MFEREERTALLLLIGVTFVLIFAYVILDLTGNRVFAVPFTSQTPDGQLVVLNGTAEKVTIIANGGHMVIECNDTTVFVPAQVAEKKPVQKGERLVLYGVVQTYRGKKEIVINDPKDILIVS